MRRTKNTQIIENTTDMGKMALIYLEWLKRQPPDKLKHKLSGVEEEAFDVVIAVVKEESDV